MMGLLCSAFIAFYGGDGPDPSYWDNVQFMSSCPEPKPTACVFQNYTERGVYDSNEDYVVCVKGKKIVYRGTIRRMIHS